MTTLFPPPFQYIFVGIGSFLSSFSFAFCIDKSNSASSSTVMMVVAAAAVVVGGNWALNKAKGIVELTVSCAKGGPGKVDVERVGWVAVVSVGGGGGAVRWAA